MHESSANRLVDFDEIRLKLNIIVRTSLLSLEFLRLFIYTLYNLCLLLSLVRGAIGLGICNALCAV